MHWIDTAVRLALIIAGVVALYMFLLRALEQWFPADREEREDE